MANIEYVKRYECGELDEDRTIPSNGRIGWTLDEFGQKPPNSSSSKYVKRGKR